MVQFHILAYESTSHMYRLYDDRILILSLSSANKLVFLFDELLQCVEL